MPPTPPMDAGVKAGKEVGGKQGTGPWHWHFPPTPAAAPIQAPPPSRAPHGGGTGARGMAPGPWVKAGIFTNCFQHGEGENKPAAMWTTWDVYAGMS